jgi:hypothetical protein
MSSTRLGDPDTSISIDDRDVDVTPLHGVDLTFATRWQPTAKAACQIRDHIQFLAVH